MKTSFIFNCNLVTSVVCLFFSHSQNEKGSDDSRKEVSFTVISQKHISAIKKEHRKNEPEINQFY